MTQLQAVETAILPLAGDEPIQESPQQRFHRLIPRWLKTLTGTKLSLIGLIIFVVIVFCAIFAPLITGSNDPSSFNAPNGVAPSPSHFFGTSNSGQDIFTQTVYGARFTLAVGAVAGLAITILSIAVGMIAGYIGGWVDDFLSMTMNVFLILPQLPLLIIVISYLGVGGDQPVETALIIAAVITITGWAWGARVMRAQTLSLRSRDFVDAAKVTGESSFRIVFRDLLPNMLALIVNTVILSFLGSIITETTLEYLGFGNTSQVTWGTILNNAQSQTVLVSHEWWCFVFPGLAIAITIMSMILMNNGVDAIANPRLRRIKGPRTSRKQDESRRVAGEAA